LIIRALVLPPALTLLGRWTWWPSRPQPSRQTSNEWLGRMRKTGRHG
jgi:uncharacterized membrane protein YdfJ with MMPL/SSD domain